MSSTHQTFIIRSAGKKYLISRLCLLLSLFFMPKLMAAQNAALVISAEKTFAETARNESIRAAFLKYLDSGGVIFQQGKMFNGLRVFNASGENNSCLLWYPEYACLSLSGDLGFTTGPFEYRNTIREKISEAGQYSTVWKKNKEGQWKVLVDLGINYRVSRFKNEMKTASFRNLSVPAHPEKDFMNVEEQFIKNYAEQGRYAFRKVAGMGTWLNLENHKPFIKKNEIKKAIQKIPDSLSFSISGGGKSEAGDILYAYGLVKYRDKQENYLRIWGHTKRGWMLLLYVCKL